MVNFNSKNKVHKVDNIKAFNSGDMKICKVCGLGKSLSEFPADKNVKSGISASCKICKQAKTRLYNKAWNERNPGRLSKLVQDWHKRNPDKHYWKKYPEKRKAYVKKKMQTDPKYREKSRQWTLDHPESVKESNRKSCRKSVETLNDRYVKRSLSQQKILVNEDTIKLKRASLKLHRIVKKLIKKQ